MCSYLTQCCKCIGITVLTILLSIFPPLGVALIKGWGKHVGISLILTGLGYIPGVCYFCYIAYKAEDEDVSRNSNVLAAKPQEPIWTTQPRADPHPSQQNTQRSHKIVGLSPSNKKPETVERIDNRTEFELKKKNTLNKFHDNHINIEISSDSEYDFDDNL